VIGGALGYLFVTETGQKIRRVVTHPDEMADNIESARTFLQSKTRMVTDQVHDVLQRANQGLEEGQRSYEKAGERLHSRTREFHGKTVENMNRTAVAIEQDIVSPIVELGALLRGIQRGIQTVLGRERKRYQAEDIPDKDRLAA
jgi:ElaB/YqjD/DUF883 family membrane-anchored ribosome-binding protein